MKIKKVYLVSIYNFLENVSLSGAASRSRTKLNKKIAESINELQSDEKDLVEEFDGDLQENGRIDFSSNPQQESEFLKAQFELRQEEAIFSETTDGQFERLKNDLYDYDEKLNGKEAEIYDLLLDLLEEQ